MRIRVKTGLVRADGLSARPGAVVEWDDADAAGLIAAGYAEPVGQDEASKPKPKKGK